jgi:nitrate reductase delta subunit
MRTLKVISALLCYPCADMQEALSEMAAAVEEEALLAQGTQAAVLDLMQRFASTDVMVLQEHYVALFDRDSALSLYLFEHALGESRDRGQAMVDLLEVYRTHGFDISVRELPDYLPLLLEYLSQQPREEVCTLLADAMHIIRVLGARLRKLGSPYHVLFEALESVAVALEGCRATCRPASAPGQRMDQCSTYSPGQSIGLGVASNPKGDC